MKTITLGGGCFWCLEAVFNQVNGIIQCESGYAGGQESAPSYEQVCSGTTGHAEVIRLEFDPTLISIEDVLNVFFAIHDPTTLNRQGHDVGTQYRSVIFYHSPEQQNAAETVMAQLTQAGIFSGPIVTQLEPIKNYHPAEPEHQRYYELHPSQPYCAYVISPKLSTLRSKFQKLLA